MTGPLPAAVVSHEPSRPTPARSRRLLTDDAHHLKPLSAAQVRTYHATEFRNARDNYYTVADAIVDSGTVDSPRGGDSEVRTSS